MTGRTLATALLGATILLSACGKKTPDTAPQPVTGGQPQAPVDQQPPPPPPPLPPTDNGATNGSATAALRVELEEMIHFDFDQAVIMGADAARLDRKAAIMRANPAVRLRIVGHCDERGSDSYNIALGMKRAGAAKDYLVRAGIDASRMEIASMGREALLDTSGSEAGMARNRRDQFDVIAGGQTLVQP